MDPPKKSTAKLKSSSSSKNKKDEKPKQEEKTRKEEKPKKDDKKDVKVKKEGKHKDDQYSSDFLRQKLREYFHHSDFKSTLQKEAIKEVMRGSRDMYISMPTGSGKSLCFQLPGMLHENKITLVFSPLIALIKDQMDHLTKLKICAESLNSKMGVKDRERVINDLKSIKPNTKFLYITPEQAATDFFRGLLDHIVKYNKLALVAVDECHCVSEMGHDFRKDYLKLGFLRKRYPKITWIALTATASKDVTSDIFKQLSLKEPKSFKTPCFRKNLFYDVIYKAAIQDDYIHLKNFIQKCLKSKGDEKPNAAPCGIVYCRTRDSVERVAIGLTKQNIVAKAYHAGVNDKERKQVQEDWTNGKFQVICATNSFGMGVDKSSVRFVVHWDTPQNIAAYYQESGRAGRDGKLSYCRIYYCRQEVKSINFLLRMSLDKQPENTKAKRSVKEFQDLVNHCESLRCRHLLFSKYFGDAEPDCKSRKMCDVCKDQKQAEQKLEEFLGLSMNGFVSKMDYAFNDSSDLYEGGRNAMQDNAASYFQDDDSEGSSSATSAREKRAAKDTSNLIQKELERRRQKVETAKKLEETQLRSSGIRVKSSIHTSKIPGLDVKKRESYLDFLVTKLRENVEMATEKPTNNLKGCDFEDIAVELEYKCFTNNRTTMMYTKAFTNERIRMAQSTKNNELLPEIKNHTPKKRTAHGGSSEAMQRDLDDFLKKNNLENGSSGSQQSSHQTTPINAGFQTARQINNKFKEPNRMKKDPMTQTSINSFFSAGSIKREPEDNMNDDQTDNQPSSKRRKVDEVSETTQVKIKTEPVDNQMDVDNEPPVEPPIKSEPIDYDSDANTDKGSDDENENEIINNVQAEHSNRPNETQANTAAETPSTRIKVELDSDNDTDTPSDDEDGRPTVTPTTKRTSKATSISTAAVNTDNYTSQPIRIKTEPGLLQHQEPSELPQHQFRNVESMIVENVENYSNVPIQIKSEPGLSHQSEAQFTNEQSMDVQQQIKNEPQDDPINSDEETDEDEPTTSNFNKSIEKQVQSATNTNYETLNQNAYLYQEPSTSQWPGFSRREDLNTNESQSNDEQSEQSHPINTDEGKSEQLHQFEEIPESEMNNDEINDDDDDFDYEDLVEIIENYSEDMEKQYEEELKKLKAINMEAMNQQQLKEATLRLKTLMKKKENIANQKALEMRRRTEQEKEHVRDTFMSRLFGPEFDAEEFEKRLIINPTEPKTSREYSQDKKDIKKVTYREIIDKPNKPKIEKTQQEHKANLAFNEHIKKMQQENKLNLVPPKMIETVRKGKTLIKEYVDRYLLPFYHDGTINKTGYETICKDMTHECFEMNVYDPDEIKTKVHEFMEVVKQARRRP